MKGIPRFSSIMDISSLKLKTSLRKECQLYATHVEEPTKYKCPSLEEFPILQEFAKFVDVFKAVHGLKPKRNIDFSIDLVPRFALIFPCI